MVFYIYWTDLNTEKQEELIEFAKQHLMDKAKEEGEEFLIRSEHEGKTWQEAYCEEYAIDYYANDEENYDWKLAVEDYIENKALDKLSSNIRAIPIEIKD